MDEQNSLKIQRVALNNFRRFESQEFHFSDQFTILIGDNGSGKTAILDAVALTLSAFLSGFGSQGEQRLAESDVRRVRIDYEDQTTSEPQYPVSVHCEGAVYDASYSWGQKMDARGKDSHYETDDRFEELVSQMLEGVKSGEDIILPLIAHYATDRLWRDDRPSTETLTPGSRLEAYDDALQSTSAARAFINWFRTQELSALQRGENKTLEAVKHAISACVPEWGEVYFDVREDELLAISPERPPLAFRFMSDGVRNMIALVADIARKAATLNPHLGPEAITRTTGIVLIDELGLHLHPNWQRRVVDDLRNTFPSVQFLATTHSPFVIQAVSGSELMDLNADSGTYEEWHSIEDIAEEVMGVDNVQRSKRFVDMQESAEEYFETLEEAAELPADERSELEEKLDQLIEPFANDPAYTAYLNIKREVKLKGNGEEADDNASSNES